MAAGGVGGGSRGLRRGPVCPLKLRLTLRQRLSMVDDGLVASEQVISTEASGEGTRHSVKPWRGTIVALKFRTDLAISAREVLEQDYGSEEETGGLWG